MSKKPKKTKDNKLLFTSGDWTEETLHATLVEIEKIAKEELGLEYAPLQLEIISADQMVDAYSSHGLPVYYNHWSLGKRFLKDQSDYQKGRSGLAYEIVMNIKPAIAYLMENNTSTMQSLVMAHLIGHAHYFQNNYMYKQWTQPEFIVEYLKFAKSYIAKCEEQYGFEAVEKVLDAAHALQYNSVDKYKRKTKTRKQQKEKYEARARYQQQSYNDLWKIIGKEEAKYFKNQDEKEKLNRQYKQKILPEPEENLLYFLEKNSPTLQSWQREILRIVRKIGVYFYPQMQDKVSNEGFACFVHYYIMNRLYEKGMISEGNMMEFLQSHTNVVFQTTPDFRTDEQKAKDRMHRRPQPFQYSGINPYALGFAMFQDIKRMCENPTEEDKKWFPEIVGKDWKQVIIGDVVANYRDESFLRQFLSPKVMRDFRLFAFRSDDQNPSAYEVLDIHNEQGYRTVRKTISEMHDINSKIPNIQIVDVDCMGDRKLTLYHYTTKNQILTEETLDVMEYVKQLWGFDVELFSIDDQEEVLECYDTSTAL